MLDAGQRLAFLERALHEGFARIYDSQVIATPTWGQIVTPTLNSPMRNAVCWSVLAEAEADARLQETLRFYQSKNLRFSWVVGPRTRPAEMGARLLAAGFRVYTVDCGMTVDLDAFSLPPRAGPQVVLELLNEDNVDAWIHVQRVVWEVPLETAARLREARRRRAFDTRDGILEYVVRFEGTVVGILAIHVLDGFAHMSTSAVLPEFRNRGIFHQIVREGLEVIRAQGRSFVTTHAIQSTSAPMLRKMGFRWECDFTYYTR